MMGHRMKAVNLVAMAVLAMWASTATAKAQHDYDLLFGFENGYATVIQPSPHPVRQMVAVAGNYLLDIGVDFFTPDGSLFPMLSRCRLVQRWISPGLVGTKSGLGTVFSSGSTPNAFALPFGGTPHHHFIFSASAPGVYVFDCTVTEAFTYQGAPLADMPDVYRIYMVAGNPPRLRGSVQPSAWYTGKVYDLWLRVNLLQGSQIVGTAEQPVNPSAIHHYLVGFNTSGNMLAVAKLSKHLSIARSVNLTGVQTWNLAFPTLGDSNEDDRVDHQDVSLVCEHFGSQHSSADLTGDAVVNLDDLYPTLVFYGQVGEGVR